MPEDLFGFPLGQAIIGITVISLIFAATAGAVVLICPRVKLTKETQKTDPPPPETTTEEAFTLTPESWAAGWLRASTDNMIA